MTLSGDEIYLKWYADKISKTVFYRIIKLDPTTSFKKERVKVGRYSKWLLSQYFKNNFQELFYLSDLKEINNVNPVQRRFTLPEKQEKEIMDALEVFHNWFKFRRTNAEHDINKYKVHELVRRMNGEYYRDYQTHKEFSKRDCKVFLIYDDENLTVLEPLNFAACYKYSKDTQWCSKTLSSYEGWSKDNMLVRFIDKKNKMIFRLTYSYNDESRWSWATPIYPEFSEHSLIKERVFPRFTKVTPFSFKFFKKEYEKYNKYEAEDTAREQAERFNQLQRLFKLMNKTCVTKALERYKFRREEYFEAKRKKEEELRNNKMEAVPQYFFN